MMLHQDASRHVWLAGEPACDIGVSLNDAMSAICLAIQVPEEGAVSTFAGLLGFTMHGLPGSLHAHRGSHDFRTLVIGGRVSDRVQEPVGRVLAGPFKALRTSPPTCPRRVAGRSGVPHAAGPATERTGFDGRDHSCNGQQLFADDVCSRAQSRFAVAAEQAGTALVPVVAMVLAEVLCHREDRVVDNDNTVALQRAHANHPSPAAGVLR